MRITIVEIRYVGLCNTIFLEQNSKQVIHTGKDVRG